MEKIYEEKNFEPNRKKINFSIVLSFIVAVFAIVSLIAVGFNQISYAAPTVPETLTLHVAELDGAPVSVRAEGASGTLYVPMYFADSKNPADASNRSLFCVEQGNDPSQDTNGYTSEGEVLDDLGLIYILNQSGVLGGPGIINETRYYPDEPEKPLSKEHARYLEIYATQTAIWLYMQQNYPSGDPKHGKITNAEYDAITNAANLYLRNGTSVDVYLSDSNLYNRYIKSVVAAANQATNFKTVTSKADSNNISLVGDNDIYQTDKIRVIANPSSDLVNYSVDISGLDGAYVVDKDGNTKGPLDTFAPSDYFYIRVPVNKVTEQNKTVAIKVVGEFQNYLSGEFYVATGKQTIVAVTSENFRVDNSNYINFLVTPDTGMTTAQTIYFIGLIVLLCGVGIIYANAKPVEEK